MKMKMIGLFEEGIVFDSIENKEYFLLTPEKSIKMTNRWILRSYKYFRLHDKEKQSIYGIIQGGNIRKIRIKSCNFINSVPTFGIAIGGAIGKNKIEMFKIIQLILNNIDKKRPIHLLGIGNINDIIKGIYYGIDTFDCIYPVKIAG